MNRQTRRFRRLIEPHLATMATVAVRLTGSEGEADDLLQETLLKAYRNLDTLVDDRNPAGWLYAIMKNSYLNALRSAARRPSLLSDPDQIGRLPSADPPIDVTVDLDRRLQAALASLPDDHRFILVAREIEGLSYQEIADLFGLPLGTVKSRVNRGREALREAWIGPTK